MSQSSKVDTLPLPSASAEPEVAPDAATLVDSYAEHLMDNLFEDVDRLLDGSEVDFSKSSGQLATVDAESDETALSAPLVELDTALQTLSSPTTAPAAPAQPAKRRRFRISLEYLMLLGALCSAAAVGVLWAISQQRLNSTVPVASGAAAAPAETAQTNPEFLNYLQRSLEVIANRTDAGGGAAAVGDMPTVATLPTPPLVLPPTPVGAAATAGTQGPVNVIERVYIPYQATAAPSPVTSAPAGAASSPSPSPSQSPTATAAAPVHTLLGLLELGSRSAALFEVSGVPQRIYIGERIGSSGWSLVSVSNDEAVIRRNGEVRSIFIGQKF